MVLRRAAKRFYRIAAIAEMTGEAAGMYSVTLDDRPVKTPGGIALTLSSEALARAIAEEWLAQEDTIRPHTMPLTQFAATALDRVGPQRQEVIDQLASYAASDLLCYRADQPQELIALQHERWQPLLDWAAEVWGARLNVTSGVLPIDQPSEAIDALKKAVEGLNDAEMTALATAVQVSGSLVVGLALVLGQIDDEAAFEVSQLDESYQIDRWGDDIEAVERRQRLREDIRAAAIFLSLTRAGSK